MQTYVEREIIQLIKFCTLFRMSRCLAYVPYLHERAMFSNIHNMFVFLTEDEILWILCVQPC